MAEPSPLRQLLDAGWNYTPGGMRIGPNQQLPYEPPGGWIEEDDAWEQHKADRARLPRPPISDEDLLRKLDRKLRSARTHLRAIENGWANRAARRRPIAERLNWGAKEFRDMEEALPQMRQRVQELRIRLARTKQRLANPTPPAPPPSGVGSGAVKTGVTGSLLIGLEGAGLWIANRLPFGGGLMTRAVLGGSGMIYGAVTWISNGVLTLMALPVVVKGMTIVVVLTVIGGAVYYVLPDGTLVPLDEEPRYAIVKQTTAGFDGGDIHLVPMERDDVDEFVEARRASTGQEVTVMLGPFDSRTEAENALCHSIVPRSVRSVSGVRMATFTFGGRWGLPKNPCPDDAEDDDDN